MKFTPRQYFEVYPYLRAVPNRINKLPPDEPLTLLNYLDKLGALDATRVLGLLPADDPNVYELGFNLLHEAYKTVESWKSAGLTDKVKSAEAFLAGQRLQLMGSHPYYSILAGKDYYSLCSALLAMKLLTEERISQLFDHQFNPVYNPSL